MVFGRDVFCDSHSAVVVHSLRRLRIYFILCDDLKQETMDKQSTAERRLKQARDERTISTLKKVVKKSGVDPPPSPTTPASPRQFFNFV